MNKVYRNKLGSMVKIMTFLFYHVCMQPAEIGGSHKAEAGIVLD
jgi:hypothetical protein